MLLVVGCSFRDTPVSVRERLAFDEAAVQRALDELNSSFGCESVILSTCNRVELYLAQPATEQSLDASLIAGFLGEFHGIGAANCGRNLLAPPDEAVRHLFRVVASLDSMIVGGRDSRQVKRAHGFSRIDGTPLPMLHALFQHAARGGRVRVKRAYRPCVGFQSCRRLRPASSVALTTRRSL